MVEGEIEIPARSARRSSSGSTPTAVAGRLLGINPFDQPDVESAKIATRGLLDARPEPDAAGLRRGRHRGARHRRGRRGRDASPAPSTPCSPLLGATATSSIQAYVDRVAHPELAELRDLIAARAKRPVTFGWGPRFLHSTGQYHKGGPAMGVFLQIVADRASDLEIPGRPFTFGQLIRAQAAGDASVLAEHGRPVLTLTTSDVHAATTAIASRRPKPTDS